MLLAGVMLAGVAAAAGLAILAIGENMLYFLTPSQVRAGEAPAGERIRVGGLVVDGSVRRPANDLEITFDLTDNQGTIKVSYRGLLPDLFREGQGIVALGYIDRNGVLQAEEVLAKHDETYMPPAVADSLRTAEDRSASGP